VQNGNETGVDCGGPDCPACPTCSDGIQNGNETGVDCGGPDCAACPTCSDGIQNGYETGIDCGGPDCSPCGTGCSSPTNLALGTSPTQDGTQNNKDADNAVDGDPNTWDSFSQTNWEPEAWWEVDLGSQNNIEEIKVWNLSPSSGNGDFLTNFHVFVSDVPFNGPSLSDAQNTPGVFDYHFTGQGAADRPTNVSVDHQGRYVRIQLAGTAFLAMAEVEIMGCAAGGPTCNDGVQNGNETGVDCGGPDCPACPTCSDGVQNGNETGVDCGGPDCPPCSGSTCSDGIQNGNETGVDCGGPDCPACCPPAGTLCDDGEANTVDDMEDGNCNCTGTPTGYCTPQGAQPWNDYIVGFTFGDIVNAPQPDATKKSAPIGDYTSLYTVVNRGNSYPFEIDAVLNWIPVSYDHTWRIWIDLNRDGDFDDPDEMVFDESRNFTVYDLINEDVDNTILIPETAEIGQTRLRVGMVRNNTTPDPCEGPSFFGEYEDYTVFISDLPSGIIVDVVWESLPIDVTYDGQNTYTKPYDNSSIALRGCNRLPAEEEGSIEFDVLDAVISNEDTYYVGLIDEDQSIGTTGTQDANYLLAISGSIIYVIESGNFPDPTANISGGNAGEKYTIARDLSGVVTYYKDDVPFYTSTVNANNLNLRPILYVHDTKADNNINVDIRASFPCDDLVVWYEKEDITANLNGSIDLLPQGATPPYSFEWSNAATTEDIVGITEPATFFVTVQDQSTPVEVEELEIDIFRLYDPQWDASSLGSVSINGQNYLKPADGTLPRLTSCNQEIPVVGRGIIRATFPDGIGVGDVLYLGFRELNAPNNVNSQFYGLFIDPYGYSMLIDGELTYSSFYMGPGTEFTIKIKGGDIIFLKNGKEFGRYEDIPFSSFAVKPVAFISKTNTAGLNMDIKVSTPCLVPPPDTETYTLLKKKLDGSYIRVRNNLLRFAYDEKYATGTGMNDSKAYTIYNKFHQATSGGTGTISQSFGTNMQELNLAAAGLTTGEFYILEVRDVNKDQVYYLRFLYL
ncbi:MAG: GEVED domain-containing protein, partial [Bacteroidota bacterium]